MEGVDWVTGRAKFMGDLEVGGRREAEVLRGLFPHATAESIDVGREGTVIENQ